MFLRDLIASHFNENTWQYIAYCIGGATCVYALYRSISRKTRIDDITKKCVFITGCDSGFGRTLALQLDKLQVSVFAGCFTTDGARSLNNEASDLLNTIQVDVSSSKSITSAFEFVCSNMPPATVFWGIVNNAGIGGPAGPTEFMDRSEFENVMQVNFLGQVDVINTFLPLLKQSKGRIVNVASIAAVCPMASNAAYCASKSAVLGYSESLRLEKKPWGISVSTIMPSLFTTNMTDANNISASRKQQWDRLPEDIKQEYGQQYYEKNLALKRKIVTGKNAKSNLSLVTEAMEDALFSIKPKARYIIGSDARKFAFIQKLPFGLSQYFSDKVHGIPNDLLPEVLLHKK